MRTKPAKNLDKGRAIMGELWGEKYDVYRPYYNQIDNTPSIIKKGAKVYVDPKGEAFMEPHFSGVESYNLFMNKKCLKSGDIILQGPLTNPNIMKSPVTILHWADMKALVGLRTGRRCNIALGKDQDTGKYNYLYKNVFYDLVGRGTPAGQLTHPLDGNGLPIPTEKAALYFRPNLASASYQNLWLIETDNTGVENGRFWNINQIDYTGPLMVLTLQRPEI